MAVRRGSEKRKGIEGRRSMRFYDARVHTTETPVFGDSLFENRHQKSISPFITPGNECRCQS